MYDEVLTWEGNISYFSGSCETHAHALSAYGLYRIGVDIYRNPRCIPVYILEYAPYRHANDDYGRGMVEDYEEVFDSFSQQDCFLYAEEHLLMEKLAKE